MAFLKWHPILTKRRKEKRFPQAHEFNDKYFVVATCFEIFRGLFSTMSNICDGAFLWK